MIYALAPRVVVAVPPDASEPMVDGKAVHLVVAIPVFLHALCAVDAVMVDALDITTVAGSIVFVIHIHAQGF